MIKPEMILVWIGKEVTPEVQAKLEETPEVQAKLEETPVAQAKPEETPEAQVKQEDTPEVQAKLEVTDQAHKIQGLIGKKMLEITVKLEPLLSNKLSHLS